MSEEVECIVLQSLIKRLEDSKKIQVAEKMIKDSGLVWRVPFQMSDTVKIIGPNHDVLKFAIECLDTIMDKDRNPACFLQNGKVNFHFLDTLGDKIFDSRKELWERHLSVEIDKVPEKCVKLECSFEDYSKIKKIIDRIRHSIPSSGSRSGSLDKSQQNGYLGSSNTPLLANKHSAILYSFSSNKIKVIIYKASIIEVDGIDAIVNAANEDLSHCGCIALEISIAAGSSVDNDCSNHVSQKGRVKVGKCCVTGPGNLRHLKGIIHAVGPRWDAYTDKKKCANDLHETVVHVLQTANARRFKKIALPAISSGVSHVPLDICAEMYVKAVMAYSRDTTPNCVTEVHFVDLNENILREIKHYHEKWQRSLKQAGDQGGARPQPGPKLYSSLRDVAGHPGLPHGGACHRPCEVHYVGKEMMPFGSQQTIFKVDNSVTVRIYSGSLVKVSSVDALVCNVGSDLKGKKLAEAFESAGGTSYIKALNDLKRPHPSVGDVVVLKDPGNLKSKYVLLAIMESKRISIMDNKTAQKLKDLYMKILDKASTYSMKRIALTLLGSGMFVNDAVNLECCCNCLFDGLTNSQVVRGICVEEIQVVNVHPEVTDAIIRVFNKRSSQSQAKINFEGGAAGGSNSSDKWMPKRKRNDGSILRAQSLKNPRDHKKEGGKREREKFSTMYDPSSPRISKDKDDNYDQGQDEKLHQKETQGNPKAGDGVSWMGTGNGGKAGNLPIFGVEAGQLKTINKFKNETCSSDICEKTAKEALSCGHKFCEICFIPMQHNHVCTICSQKSSETNMGASLINPRKVTKTPEASSNSDTCIICMEKLTIPYKLPCGHDSFHEKCINEAFVYKEVCPLCGKILGTVTGSQPEKGTIKITKSTRSLPGYEECGLIEIFYEFRDGIQSENHPHPGKPYRGTRRKAYLPDNREGQKVLKMLEVAFDRKLVFTIGESRTTGKADTVTWNDIHHKTKMEGGPSNYGYPDPDYLRRVKEELEAKGVTEADI